MTTLGLFCAAAGFVLFMALHLVVIGTKRFPNRLGVIVTTFIESLGTAIILALVLAPLVLSQGDDLIVRLGAAFVTLMTMLCLFVVYMPFYYVIATSLSVQTMVALAQMPAGSISLSEVLDQRRLNELLDLRLESMVRAGTIQRSNGRYQVTQKGRRTARTFGALRRLWGLGPGG